jgi:hypothetical protein
MGRPDGSMSSKTFAMRCAAYLVRVAKDAWCGKRGLKNLPPQTRRDRTRDPNAPPLDTWVQCAIDIVEREFPKVRNQITPAKVKRQMRFKPDPQIIEHFAEDYSRRDERAMQELGKRG